jgi:hypothetical protein
MNNLDFHQLQITKAMASPGTHPVSGLQQFRVTLNRDSQEHQVFKILLDIFNLDILLAHLLGIQHILNLDLKTTLNLAFQTIQILHNRATDNLVIQTIPVVMQTVNQNFPLAAILDQILNTDAQKIRSTEYRGCPMQA